MITSTQRSARTSRPVRLLLTVLAGYLVGRGFLEPFVIDMGDPATYRHDWGGPSLFGVLAVHCAAAVLILGYGVLRLRRRIAARGRLTH